VLIIIATEVGAGGGVLLTW